jgi:hypothetical protein
MSILTMLLFAMLHDTSGIPVYIIRDSELGMYDTTLDTVNTIFDFDKKWVIDGRNLHKPKYQIEVIK